MSHIYIKSMFYVLALQSHKHKSNKLKNELNDVNLIEFQLQLLACRASKQT